MAITMTCPRCSHKNTFDEAKAQQQVHCRICHHVLALGAGAASPAPAPAESPDLLALVKEGPPPRTEPRRADEERPIPSKRTRASRDDRDDDRRRPTRRPTPQGDSSVLVWLIGGAGLLMALGCCVSAPVVYLFFAPSGADEQVAAIAAPPEDPADDADNRPMQFDRPNFNPPPPKLNPPPPVRLDPNNPADVDLALAMLKQGGNDFNEACRWLRAANANHPQRDQVARALEALLENQMRQPFPHGDFVEAYFRWATKDNFPSLLRMVQDGDFSRIRRRHQAMETLGRLKDGRAAEAIVQRLPEIHDRFAAMRALEELGPAAEPVLVKHMNDANRDIRGPARAVLRKQGNPAAAMLAQTLADLQADDEPVRAAALEWLGEAPFDEQRRPDVARALDPLIRPRSVQGPLLKALQIWGTPENALAIANNLDAANIVQFREQVQLLGKFKDARTVPALVSHFSGPGLVGISAREALKQFGKVAEPEVVKLVTNPNRLVQLEVCRLLSDIGTPDVSVPALEAAIQANPNDAFFAINARNTIKAIRAKAAK